MVELYTMIKFSLLVTPTNFRRRLSIKWIMRCLQDHGCIQVGSAADDVVFEVHPPGTGDQLRALSQALGEMSDAEAGSIFRVLEDGSLKLLAEGG